MLLLLKKSGAKAGENDAYAWHPNFRDSARLPDTKTVRTKFFVNIIAISAVCALALLVVLREMNLAVLRSDLADVEREIEEATKPSAVAVAVYKLFQNEEKTLKEAADLAQHPFRISDFLIHLGGLLPKGVKLKRVDYRGLAQGVNVSASVNGLDADASDIVSAFVQTLKADAYLTRDFPVITQSGLARSVADETINFELSFAPKPVAAPKGAAGKRAADKEAKTKGVVE